MKTLFAGPWMGEFGYELFEWQGKLRAMSTDYDKVIISSREGNELLYEDFCDEFIPFNTSLRKCSEHFNIAHENFDINKFINSRGIQADTIITDCTFQHAQKFIQYGKQDEKDIYDIVVHARLFRKYKATRNWKPKQWSDLISILLNEKPDLKICSVGISDVAMHVPNTENRMDISLKELADIMASSKICLGQSSGAMHFASLCGCKQVVWSSKKNRERYLKDWNPLNTEVVFYQKERWKPKVASILNLVKSNLDL
jgi:ADP-heptose:LPS heptosyltransferase